MKLLIKNADIATMGEEFGILKQGCIGIADDTICFVGKEPDLAFQPDKIIDASGRIAMPGLVNAHTHSPMVMFRNFASDLPLHNWMFDKIRPLQQHVTGEDVKTACSLALIEMIKSGTTCFMEMYNWTDVIFEVVSDFGMRANMGGSYSAVMTKRFSERTDEIRSHFRQWNGAGGGLLKESLVLHSLYDEKEEDICSAIELAHELNAQIQIHVSETVREKEDIFQRYHDTTIGVLERMGMFHCQTVMAHMVHLEEEDFAICRQYRQNVSGVHCPSSNMKLASGFAPAARMLQEGICLALGTDGAASNNTLNLFREIYLASVLQKGYLQDAACMGAESVLRMATANGARAAGFSGLTGSIEVGKKADLILISTEEPHMCPVYDHYASLVYAAQGSDVETVIVNGKILMEDREIKVADEEKIKWDARAVSKKILPGFNG